MKKLTIEKTTGEKVTLITKENIRISEEPLAEGMHFYVRTLDNNFWINVEELVKLQIEDITEGE